MDAPTRRIVASLLAIIAAYAGLVIGGVVRLEFGWAGTDRIEARCELSTSLDSSCASNGSQPSQSPLGSGSERSAADKLR
jgi:hypothetical protein